MFRRTVSGIMLSLILISMFFLAFNIRPVKSEWTGTVYIRADGSIDPPDAPIITCDNITYILKDNVTSFGSGIVIERDNVVINGENFCVKGLNHGEGIMLWGRINITVRNIQIEGFFFGIRVCYSNDIALNNIIVANNFYGVDIVCASNVTLKNFDVRYNLFNFGVQGLEMLHFYHNIDNSNRINGRPIYYWINKQNETVPSNAGYIALINCSDIRIFSCNLTNNLQGILLVNATKTIIEKNVIKNTVYGIVLRFSSNNTILKNNITEMKLQGITLDLLNSSNIDILENNLIDGYDGIFLLNSSNNILKYNYIANMKVCGIIISDSTKNTVSENTFFKNFEGIFSYCSSMNNIFHNNFVENYRQIDTVSSENIWDDSYPSGGNYWSDYTGIDLYSGPYQNETGSDGIGDTPYVIDENNVDHYPLMSPWTKIPVVIAKAIPDILNLIGKGRWVTAYIELLRGYNVRNINASTILLNDTIPVDLEAPIEIGDYDEDGIPDLMVKFNRTAVSELILSMGIKYGDVTLTVAGRLYDGTEFEGSDTIRVRMPGDINMDGMVDTKDISIVARAFGSYPNHPRWNHMADENEDDTIDMKDIALAARNFGKTYT